MNINILAVGKIKEAYIKNGLKEFEKRMRPYARLNIKELPDLPAPENLSDKDLEKIKIEEGKNILDTIDRSSYLIALDIKGKSLSSEELASKIEDLSLDGYSSITFIIGGSNGLSKQVLDQVDYKLSFSKMTFPHQLMRLILLEQIYRSYRIIHGHPYHK